MADIRPWALSASGAETDRGILLERRDGRHQISHETASPDEIVALTLIPARSVHTNRECSMSGGNVENIIFIFFFVKFLSL